mgnify:CR=1 FL=1
MGLTHQAEFLVQDRHTVPFVEPDWPGFADMPAVLATAIMIGFMEQTCIQALRPFLQPGAHTVGTEVCMSHCSATLPGQQVKAVIELTQIEKRSLSFRVACFDEQGLIGEGTHKRVIIDVERFMARLAN